MRTQLMIALIVGACAAAAIAVLAGLVWWWGRIAGGAVWLGLAVGLGVAYAVVLRPWHLRWGATDDEVDGAMPGDELIPEARSATRAITIRATPDQVWPWLVQLGYGRAGWYSYDWIDNDFRPSADRIVTEYQRLRPGDRILMMPEMGFVVRFIDKPRAIVSVLEDGSTSWCLGLSPTPEGGTRLVSRWRPNLPLTVKTVLMTALAEPGTFIMEQKMLRTIRDRVEASKGGRG